MDTYTQALTPAKKQAQSKVVQDDSADRLHFGDGDESMRAIVPFCSHASLCDGAASC